MNTRNSKKNKLEVLVVSDGKKGNEILSTLINLQRQENLKQQEENKHDDEER